MHFKFLLFIVNIIRGINKKIIFNAMLKTKMKIILVHIFYSYNNYYKKKRVLNSMFKMCDVWYG